jgi:thymidine phosphorylase
VAAELPQETIRRLRDRAPLGAAEIEGFVAGITAGRVTDAQIAAFCMAALLNGLDRTQTVALTRAMTRSGTVLDWSGEDLPGPVLDKHSTGGVGDAVSLILAPLVAACGGFVPMISGRGLGHTGGTLDKFEAIPGYDVRPDPERFRRTVREVGCAVIGQTTDLAPADRRIYAVRDVTATVESIPLITASILSKKLAAGLGGLVMDVKTGSGAFMPTGEASRELARTIVEVARGAGLPTVALVTDMDAPLARSAGNAVEMREAIDVLNGRIRAGRLRALTVELAAEMLALGGLCPDVAAGRVAAEKALTEGGAAERFGRMVAELGGPRYLVERPHRELPEAPLKRPVEPERAGVLLGWDTRALGLAVVALGGGRTRPEDPVDPAVGLTAIAEPGAEAGPGRPLCLVHARDEAGFEAAAARVRAAARLGEPGERVEQPPLVHARLAG